MPTIDLKLESQVNSSDVLNIDNLRGTYVVKDLNFIFKSPFFAYFEQQKDYLIYESKLIEMTPRYYQRPEYLSYDQYGTVVLAPFLMFINNVYSRIDFKDEYIIVPKLSSVKEVISSAYDFFNVKIETTSIELKKIELLDKY